MPCRRNSAAVKPDDHRLRRPRGPLGSPDIQVETVFAAALERTAAGVLRARRAEVVASRDVRSRPGGAEAHASAGRRQADVRTGMPLKTSSGLAQFAAKSAGCDADRWRLDARDSGQPEDDAPNRDRREVNRRPHVRGL